MKRHLTIDSAGRIVLPKPIRDQMGLGAGDALEIGEHGEAIVLHPVRSEDRMIPKRGIGVMKATGQPMTVTEADRILTQVRLERNRKNAGGSW